MTLIVSKHYVSKNETYIKNMASYFAKHCPDSYQRKILNDTLGTIPDDIGELSENFFQWLYGDNSSGTNSIDRFLKGLSNNTTFIEQIKPGMQDHLLTPFPNSAISVYYGVDSKRKVVVCFYPRCLNKTNRENFFYIVTNLPTG